MRRWLSPFALALSALVSPADAGLLKPSPHIDDNALRYYASLGQTDRVAAEARRLSALDPHWHVPDDLYAARPGRSDEAPLWQLYREGRFDDIDGAIAMRRAAEPNWNPSPDIVAKMTMRRLRTTIMTLAKTGQWHEVVQSVKETGITWAKDDAEVLWVIAEAYAHGNDCVEAFAIYHSILAGHQDANERRATIDNAMALIPMAMTEKLIAMGQVDDSGKSEFDPIALDITRARMSAVLHDEPANAVSDADLKHLEDAVRGAADPDQLGLVAWYAFKRHDDLVALEWFKLAIARGGDAMIAHGLAHTLRRLDRRREAEEVAYAWREPLVNNAILFIDLLETDLTKEHPPFIEADRLTRYAQVTMATESGEGAQALGWYAYNTCQYPLALQWFERASAWLPKEATVYGYALALQRLHRAKDFRDVVNRYDGLFPKVVALAFDDDVHKPPPACETRPGLVDSQAGDPVGSAGVDWTGRTMADTLHPQAAVKIARLAVMPSPDVASGRDAGVTPLKKRTEFPVPIAPENQLRFSSMKTVRTEDIRDKSGTWPLVARRVPGVGAMPYERYGFTLLPGWDGTREASSPTAAERNAAAGTLWALEQSLRDAAYAPPPSQSADALPRVLMMKANTDPVSLSGGRS